MEYRHIKENALSCLAADEGIINGVCQKRKRMAKIVSGRFPANNNRESSHFMRQGPEIGLSSFGVDKLCFHLPEHDGFVAPICLPDGWSKKVVTDVQRQETETWSYHDGSKHLHFELAPDKSKDGGERLLIATTNPSRAVHDYLLLNDNVSISQYVSDVLDVLEASGFKKPLLETAKVFRYDYANSLHLEKEWATYASVVASFQAKRKMHKRHHDSQCFGNTQNQLILYDKKAELIDRGLRDNSIPENFIRSELRALKADSVNRIFRTNNLLDLIAASKGHPNIYNDYLKKDIFRQVLQRKINYDFSDLDEIYHRYVTENGTARGHSLFMQSIGVIFLVEDAESFNYLLNVIIPKYQSRSTAYRHKREIINQLQKWRIKCPVIGDDSWVMLNQELRNKMLIAV